MVTGIWGRHVMHRHPRSKGKTDLARIIPFSVGKWEDADEEKPHPAVLGDTLYFVS